MLMEKELDLEFTLSVKLIFAKEFMTINYKPLINFSLMLIMVNCYRVIHL